MNDKKLPPLPEPYSRDDYGNVVWHDHDMRDYARAALAHQAAPAPEPVTDDARTAARLLVPKLRESVANAYPNPSAVTLAANLLERFGAAPEALAPDAAKRIAELSTFRPVWLLHDVTMHRDVRVHEAGWLRRADVLEALESHAKSEADADHALLAILEAAGEGATVADVLDRLAAPPAKAEPITDAQIVECMAVAQGSDKTLNLHKFARAVHAFTLGIPARVDSEVRDA